MMIFILKGETMPRFFTRFFALFAVSLATALSIPAAYAEAEDAPSFHAAKSTELLQFKDAPIAAADTADAAQKTHDAILKAAQTRKWQVIQNTPAVIRLKLNVRNKHFVTIDAEIKNDKVDIVYVDSDNMNYEKLSSGQEFIHPKYNAWVKILLKSARAAARK
jgi:hypothetical protein